MRRRKALDVGKRGSRGILNHFKKKKIGDAQVVEPIRDGGMPANTIQCIAEDEQRANAGVKERLDAQLIARAEEAARSGIPNGKSEISHEVFHTLFAPRLVGTQDEFRISGFGSALLTVGPQGGNQVLPAVYAGVGDNPGIAVQSEELVLVTGLGCNAQKGVSKPDLTAKPSALRVWSAKREKVCEPLKKNTVNRGAVEIEDADNSAHGGFGDAQT